MTCKMQHSGGAIKTCKRCKTEIHSSLRETFSILFYKYFLMAKLLRKMIGSIRNALDFCIWSFRWIILWYSIQIGTSFFQKIPSRLFVWDSSYRSLYRLELFEWTRLLDSYYSFAVQNTNIKKGIKILHSSNGVQIILTKVYLWLHGLLTSVQVYAQGILNKLLI